MTAAKVSRDILKQATQKAKSHADNIRTWAKERMASYAEYLRKQTEEFAAADATAARLAEEWAEAMAKLKAAGFKPRASRWSGEFDVTLTVKKRQLNRLYHAIGRLDGKKLCKDIHDAQNREVAVTMPSVAYPFLAVTYVHKLGPKDKCQIEAVEVPARTEHRLVCEVN